MNRPTWLMACIPLVWAAAQVNCYGETQSETLHKKVCDKLVREADASSQFSVSQALAKLSQAESEARQSGDARNLWLVLEKRGLILLKGKRPKEAEIAARRQLKVCRELQAEALSQKQKVFLANQVMRSQVLIANALFDQKKYKLSLEMLTQANTEGRKIVTDKILLSQMNQLETATRRLLTPESRKRPKCKTEQRVVLTVESIRRGNIIREEQLEERVIAPNATQCVGAFSELESVAGKRAKYDLEKGLILTVRDVCTTSVQDH